MIHSEDDLRAGLASRERLVPETESVLAGVARAERRNRRRRVAGLSTAIACAVAVAVVVPVLLVGPQQSAPPPTAPSPTPSEGSTIDVHAADRPDFYFTVLPTTVGSYELHPNTVHAGTNTVHAGSQLVMIVRAGSTTVVAQLRLHRPGEWQALVAGLPPGEADRPVNTQVHGNPASYMTLDRATRLTWDYAPEAVAELVGYDDREHLPESTLVEIAEGVRFTAPYPALVPYRLDYLPADLVLNSVGRGFNTQLLSFRGERRFLEITVNRDRIGRWPFYPQWTLEDAVLGGRPVQCRVATDEDLCLFDYDGLTVAVSCSGVPYGEAGFRDDFDRIIGGMRLSDLDDPSTWYPVDEAIPGS